MTIADHFMGWSLSEIRRMSYRQRNYWIQMIKHRREKMKL
jgi:hypothetical protein